MSFHSSLMSIAAISLRGTIISSAVTFSKSRILTSMSWCFLGIIVPASYTTVRSSSRLRESPPSPDGLIRNRAKMPLVMPLIAATSGYITTNNGDKISELGKAIFSGYNAARVFGVTSAKISRIIVSPIVVANTAQYSPNQRVQIIVAMAEAAMLTRLLPIRIKPINRSGRSSSLCTRLAPRCPSPCKCLSRYRLIDIMPVSELEKYADKAIKIASAINNALVDMSSN